MNILAYLDSKNTNYRLASNNKEATFPCPVCGVSSKFYVNVETGAFICFRGSCGIQGGLKDLIKLLGDEGKEVDITVSEKPREIQDPEPITPEVVEEYHQALLKNYSPLEKYFTEKRGYTIETIKKFKLGWGGRSITIPIFDEKGNCVNFKQKPDPTVPNPAKGMYSIAGRGRSRLFNSRVLTGEEKPKEVIICEGEWDCMKLDQEGYVAVSSTTGTGSFKPEWIPLFQGVGKIYLCQDNDENGAGQNGTKKVARMFADQKIPIYLVNLPNPKKGIEEKIDVTDFFTKLGKTKEHFDLLLQTAQPFIEEEKEDDDRRLADYLCELATGAGIVVFLDQNEEAYLIFPEQPLAAYPVYGGKLRGWLSSLYMEVSGRGFSGDVFKEVTDYLYAKAVHEGKTLQLWNRVAMVDGTVYYDLGDGQKIVTIDKTGWKITNKAPVRFKRFSHQLLQVEPVAGDLTEVLKFVNLKNETDGLLFLTYLITGLNPIIPRALLTLFGDQGSAKSTALRVTRCILDPSNAGTNHPSKAGNLLSPPKDETDLANKTLRHYCLYLDNLSSCPDWLSDAFARITTGSSFSKRKLYTDTDEITINAMPLLGINGINLVVERPDLLDRLLILEMERIPDDARKTERKFWEEFRETLPRILGGLFTSLSKTLAVVEGLTFEHLPRMADYATFATAGAVALGKTQGEFISAFTQNIKKQNQSAVDSSVVAQVILEFMDDKEEWKGTSSELHKALMELATKSNLRIGGEGGFPKASNWLWKKIQIIRPNLNSFGIKAEHSEDKFASTVKLTKSSKDSGNTTTTGDTAILASKDGGGIDGGIPDGVVNVATDSEAKVATGEVVAAIPLTLEPVERHEPEVGEEIPF
jgi:hypothetical protein